LRKHCINYDKNHVKCGKKTESMHKLWDYYYWILVLIEQIPLEKEVWADERCYYLDKVQSTPTPADKNNRITQLQQHTLRHNNSGIVNKDSQYQMHDLGPDQNGQSMTATK